MFHRIASHSLLSSSNHYSVKENPPNKVFTKDECERIIVSLMIADVLFPNVKFTTYNNIVYIGLKGGPRAMEMLERVPKVRLRLPVRDRTEAPKSSKKKSSPTQGQRGWISKKTPTAKKRATKRSTKAKATKRKSNSSTGKTTKAAKTSTAAKKARVSESDSSIEVINILDDSSDEENSNDYQTRSRAQGGSARRPSSRLSHSVLDNLGSLSSENEFE